MLQINVSKRREMVYNLEYLKRERKVIGAIRRGNWKLIKTKHKLLLFNLEDDENERKNLATSKKTMVTQLKMLFDKMASSIVRENKKPKIRDHSDVDRNGYVQSGWCRV